MNKNARIGGLDTIRSVAMFLILIYHFFGNILPGGFLGLNVLFVLSGFLIAHHLIAEVKETGRTDLGRFYHKRFLRIVPAVLLMVLIGLLLTLFASADYRTGILRQVAGVLSFNMNWYEILSGGSYEAQFLKPVFLHMWSLGPEIHFYIILPPLFLLLLFLTRKRKNPEKSFEGALLRVSLLLLALCYALTLFGTFSGKLSVSFRYFSDFTRMGSFFLGTFSAAFFSRYRLTSKVRSGYLWIGFALLTAMAFVTHYESALTYIGGFLLTDILSVALIAICVTHADMREARFFRFFSGHSYNIYVFHYPFLILLPTLFPRAAAYPLTVVATAIAVFCCQRFWEPLFAVEKGGAPKKQQAGMASVPVILVLTLVLNATGPDLISLERNTWRSSVGQDIAQITRAKEDVQTIIETGKSLQKSRITLIGDSVSLGPAEFLSSHIPNLQVNAEVSRFLDEGDDVIAGMEKEGTLGNIVIVALGTQRLNRDAEQLLLHILDVLPSETKLILVTPYDGNSSEDHPVGLVMRSLAEKNKWITVMDWENIARKHAAYYADSDGIHFYGNQDAYDGYLQALQDALTEAVQKPGKDA